MDPVILKQKMADLMQLCSCGSLKQGWQCCRKGEVAQIADEACICGSGKMVKDCCMQSPETH